MDKKKIKVRGGAEVNGVTVTEINTEYMTAIYLLGAFLRTTSDW